MNTDKQEQNLVQAGGPPVPSQAEGWRWDTVLAIGAGMGALDGVGIFWAPGEPYKIEIFLAAILNGVLVSLIVALSLRGRRPWWQGLGYGVLYGVAFALVVFLAKGGFRSMDAPYVVPADAVMGGLTGLLIARFGFRSP